MESLTLKVQSFQPQCVVVGAGLAGAECTWQLAKRGIRVLLMEQRPQNFSAAHKTPDFAELVCSNSLKSTDPLSAPALLKAELTDLDSLILKVAKLHQVPAGQALAVERVGFSKAITEILETHPSVAIYRQELCSYQELLNSLQEIQIPIVFATGPLTSDSLAKSLETLVGQRLSFYDAISPIVDGTTINRDIAFTQNRYDKNVGESGEGDYLNCPLDKEQYYKFVADLIAAEKVEEKSFEKIQYFQGCQPIEAIAEKGERSLSFGPMKARGLTNPHSEKRPYAVVQLRKEDKEGRSWNIVGFQTKMKYPEQKRIFRSIPGLELAEFFRLGSIHRNTYLLSPVVLNSQLELKDYPQIYFAGQITGVEGYLESTAIGAYVGYQIAEKILHNNVHEAPPDVSALGALVAAITQSDPKKFQPMNTNWGLVPLKDIGPRDKDKKEKLVKRGREEFSKWLNKSQLQTHPCGEHINPLLT